MVCTASFVKLRLVTHNICFTGRGLDTIRVSCGDMCQRDDKRLKCDANSSGGAILLATPWTKCDISAVAKVLIVLSYPRGSENGITRTATWASSQLRFAFTRVWSCEIRNVNMVQWCRHIMSIRIRGTGP